MSIAAKILFASTKKYAIKGMNTNEHEEQLLGGIQYLTAAYAATDD